VRKRVYTQHCTESIALFDAVIVVEIYVQRHYVMGGAGGPAGTITNQLVATVLCEGGSVLLQ